MNFQYKLHSAITSLNVHADVFRGAEGPDFSLIFYLLPCFVYSIICTEPQELSLFTNGIRTHISCTDPYVLIRYTYSHSLIYMSSNLVGLNAFFVSTFILIYALCL